MEVLVAILIGLATLLVSVFIWAYWQATYWRTTKIPYVPGSLILGNFTDVFLQKSSSGELFTNLYEHQAAKSQPIVGINIFHKPALLIKDLELIKRILIKDFNKFSNRYTAIDPKIDKLGASNLFTIKNPEWRGMRLALTSFFSSAKLKNMYPLINQIGNILDDELSKISTDTKSNEEQEIREICALYTTDIVASVAFGIEANSLRNPQGEFRLNGKKFFLFTFKRAIQFMFVFFIPQLVSFFRCKMFNEDVATFLRSTTEFAIEDREKSGKKRNDLIDILIELKKSENKHLSKNVSFEGDVLVSQTATFFLAGFESSSSTMSFSLYELSKNPEIQKKLREEIRKILKTNDGDITYSDITEMVYLNAVVSETLRKYPPLPFLDRECTLSDGEPGYSLEPVVDFNIPNGMPVYIPVYAIHHDPKYYPNPEIYDPERFMPDNKDNITPYSYMPFGTGPHNCVGERLGLIQVKIGLVYFLKNHYVTCAPRSEVLKFDKKALNLQPLEGIFCYVRRDPLFD